MKKYLKIIVIALAVVIVGTGISIPVIASASDAQEAPAAVQTTDQQDTEETAEAAEAAPVSGEVIAAESQTKSTKAMAAAIVVGIAAAAGAIAMGLAISKAAEGTARQPEAGGRIQTMLMLGLVFIETAIIYALIVAILVIFVL